MKTNTVKIDENDIGEREEAYIAEAGEIIKNGGLVVFPTETVYGLGADAFNEEGAARIYKAKGRPSDNPLIVHIADINDLEKVACFENISVNADVISAASQGGDSEKETEKTIITVDLKKGDVQSKGIRISEARKEKAAINQKNMAYALAKRFWPGPLTLILPKTGSLPKQTTGGLDTVAVRFPSHTVARKLIKAAGGFVAAPSANISGRPSPTDARYCIEDMDGLVEMIIDSGETQVGLESTIVDLTGDEPVILRPGVITKEDIDEALGIKRCNAEGRAETSCECDAEWSEETSHGISGNFFDEQGKEYSKVNPKHGDKECVADISGENEKEYGKGVSPENQYFNDVHPKAPGMKYRHYAPRGEMTVVDGESPDVVAYINKEIKSARATGKKTLVISSDETAHLYEADAVESIGSAHDGDSIAHNLYRLLRRADDENAEVIYSEAFRHIREEEAIMNRLVKAAGGRVVRLTKA